MQAYYWTITTRIITLPHFLNSTSVQQGAAIHFTNFVLNNIHMATPCFIAYTCAKTYNKMATCTYWVLMRIFRLKALEWIDPQLFHRHHGVGGSGYLKTSVSSFESCSILWHHMSSDWSYTCRCPSADRLDTKWPWNSLPTSWRSKHWKNVITINMKEFTKNNFAIHNIIHEN